MNTGVIRLLPAILALVPLTVTAVDDYASAQFEILYAAEPILPDRIAVQYSDIPENETWVRIRHMGDLGTPQLTDQATNRTSSDRSSKTGLLIPVDRLIPRELFQRGYEDDPARGTNVYQVYGYAFGWHVNTYQFGHEGPIECPPAFPDCSGGPNIAYSRRFEPALEPWTTPSSEFTMQAYLAMPFVHYDAGPSTAAAQVSFLYYLQHVDESVLIAGLVNLFDSRAFEAVGFERVGGDGVSGYVSSDLRDAQPDGRPNRYVTRSPYSSASRNRWGWENERFFRAHVSRENLLNILADTGSPGDPEDYRVIEASILVEAFPRVTSDISFAGSLRHFELYRFHEDD